MHKSKNKKVIEIRNPCRFIVYIEYLSYMYKLDY